ncbi:MAG: hypothetical protein ACK5Z5_05475 [Neisseriaceae bacterium]|jgi:hypothetical protein
MHTFTRHTHSIDIIYNNPNIIASLVNKNGDILYISEAMQELGKNKIIHSKSNIISKNRTLENLNKVVIKSKKTIKYIYVMQISSTEFTLFNCTKQPVFENHHTNPAAILTIQDQFKIINKEDMPNNTSLPILHEIERAILLCVNLKLSHGEIYQFIANQYKEKLTFREFKTYCDILELISKH